MSDLHWTVHPARRSPRRAVFALAVVALAAAFARTIGGHVGWALAAATFLLVCVAPFLFPTRYRLSPEGVEVRLLGARRRRRWSDLRLVRESAEGALLSPGKRWGLLDPVRTIFVRYPDDPAAARRFVRERFA